VALARGLDDSGGTSAGSNQKAISNAPIAFEYLRIFENY
jgi:hypothetical protein